MSRSCIWTAVALSLALSCPGVAHAQTPAELTTSGLSKLKEGDLKGAVADLDRAAQLDPSAPILFNLAQAEIKLGQLADAERHLQEAKVLAEQSGPKALIGLSDKALSQLADRVPKLEIVSVPDAERLELKLDGKRIKGVDHRINPGGHKLVASADGFESHTEEFSAAEGKTMSLSFSLARKKAPKTSQPIAEESEPGSELPVGPITLGAAGLVAAGAGVYFYTRVASIDDDRTREYEQAGCPGPSCPTEPESARLLREDSEQAALFGNVLVGVGAAAVVGAGVWWILSDGDAKQPNVGLSIGPTRAQLHGRF